MEELEQILKNLMFALPEITSANVTSIEGLPIKSILPQNIDETMICAITSAFLSLAERSIIEIIDRLSMEKGEFEQLYVQGDNGYILIIQAGSNAILSVSTTKNVKIGLAFLECQRASKEISKII